MHNWLEDFFRGGEPMDTELHKGDVLRLRIDEYELIRSWGPFYVIQDFDLLEEREKAVKYFDRFDDNCHDLDFIQFLKDEGYIEEKNICTVDILLKGPRRLEFVKRQNYIQG